MLDLNHFSLELTKNFNADVITFLAAYDDLMRDNNNLADLYHQRLLVRSKVFSALFPCILYFIARHFFDAATSQKHCNESNGILWGQQLSGNASTAIVSSGRV